MSATTDRASPLAGKKPRLALFLATGFGLGYLPLAPGTWGSLGGLALLLGLAAPFLDSFGLIFSPLWRWLPTLQQINADVVLYFEILATVLVAVLGVWASERAAKFLGSSDPHQVVVDEISGMGITLVVGLGAGIYPIRFRHLEAVSGAAGRALARRLGHNGRRLGRGHLRSAGALAGEGAGVVATPDSL